ncbi:MAG: Gluconate 2-dehydrogenase subunit 3 precursor [Bryobacterales bacterium]|jgi:gluconate 2-dehydrogenase gamma chain|nr:Gluconate 2-dehydrogenase subunit 3 precursor [Bryobacterales bacterium]
MAKYSTDRRSLLKIIGTVGATCAYPFASDDLYGQTADQHHHTPPEQQAQPRFFNDADFQTISRIAELIIPETDTPGAIRSGVPSYIDLIIARNTDQQLVVADGLRWLDAESRRVAEKPFLALTEGQQLAILEPLCDASDSGKPNPGRNVQFFSLVKNLTADGYYTSKIGLIDELQYKGDKVLSSYPSCNASR